MTETIDHLAVALDERVSMVAILWRNAVNHAEPHAGLAISEWRVDGWVSTLDGALGLLSLRRQSKLTDQEQRVLYDWADWNADRYGEPFPCPEWVKVRGRAFQELDR